ncbi:hypothetical protein Y032_0167g104 [Ancylostoma ceylanicum]|uniref:Uncharacterized protein n=1 Tax=Ancylostoma ceylanicum TaxID=53326 RepID=A0A016SVK4_9BILA|nr:hypothetical protein Y032_0167g104 [Ancylostoma ceylanicum]
MCPSLQYMRCADGMMCIHKSTPARDVMIIYTATRCCCSDLNSNTGAAASTDTATQVVRHLPLQHHFVHAQTESRSSTVN